ncbi:MAG: HU family DNA-binding protein [Pseudomonadota bacterium]
MYVKRNLSKVIAEIRSSQNEIELYVDALDHAIKMVLSRSEPVILPGLGKFTPEEYSEKKESQPSKNSVKANATKTLAFIPQGTTNSSVH